MQNKTLYILDDDNIDIPKDSKVVFLNKDSDKYLNKLNLIDVFTKQQEELKHKLLNFNKLVFEKIKPMIDKDSDYEYLLTSLFFEKSPYKTDTIYIFYKLNIILDFIKTNKVNKICLNTKQSNIIEFFFKFSKQNNIVFENLENHKIKNEIKNEIKDIVSKNFYLSSLYLLNRENKKISKKIYKHKKRHDRVVISYYPDYYFEGDEFISKYFESVSKELNKNYDWLFIYADDINKINNEQDKLKEYHFNTYNFLDNFISIGDIFDVLKKANNLYRKFKKIKIDSLFYFNSVDYYDIMIDDWKKSLSLLLIDTLIFEKKFDNFFKAYTYDEIIYLMEYQPWENMLNKIAKKYNIFIKGVTHSVIRPNLMNYYHDELVHKYLNTPDLVGSNSPLADKIFKQNGFNNTQIKPIEAQRFMYLIDINPKSNIYTNNLLITTSISYEETKELLINFALAYKTNNIFNNIYIKAHPNLPVDSIIKEIDSFPKYNKLNGSMKEAFALVDVVFTANSSSVLLESVFNNKKTVTFFSLNTLPMPAIDSHPLLFVGSSIIELENIFLNILDNNVIANKNINNNLLYLNKNLTYWREFLNDKKNI
jgi:surface carbohydrate biosynthesis protein (TIGR04326 family)